MLRLQEMTSDATEQAFIQSLDGTKQLDVILSRAEIPRDKARLLLVALSEAGMIERHETTARRKRLPTPPPPLTSPLLPTGSGSAPPATAPLASGQLAMMLQTVRTQDYFWALGVDQDAAAAEVDRAYEALARSFHADRYRLGPDDDRKAAQEIFERLTEAHRTLRDPARRKAYVAKLTRTPEDTARRRASRSATDRPRPPAASATAGVGAVERGGARALRSGARAPQGRGATTRPSKRCGRRPAWSPTRPTFAPRSGGRCFARPRPTRAPGGRPSPSCGARCSWTNATARRRSTWRRSTPRPGNRISAVQELERLLAIDPAATEVAEELHRLRIK